MKEKRISNDEVVDIVDLGTIAVPVAEKFEEPWLFRAGCTIVRPDTSTGLLTFDIVLDLGFGIYKQIHAVLEGHIVSNGKGDLVVAFAENWCANGDPNPLTVETVRSTVEGGTMGMWFVHVYRTELELETLHAIGLTCLGDALVEQGLMVSVKT